MRAILADPENLGGKLPETVAHSKMEDDPQSYRDIKTNIKTLSFFTGEDEMDIAQNYEQAKQNFVKANAWDMPGSDAVFRNQLAGHFQMLDSREKAVDDLHTAAFADAAAGNVNGVSRLQKYEDWTTQHADALKGVPDSQKFATFQSVYWNRLQSFDSQHLALAKEIADLTGMQTDDDQEKRAGEWQQKQIKKGNVKPKWSSFGGKLAIYKNIPTQEDDIVDQLGKLSPQDRQQTYRLAASLEHSRNAKNYQYGFSRSLYSIGQAAQRSVDSLGDAVTKDSPKARIALELKSSAKNLVNPLPYAEMNPWEASKQGLPVIGTKIAQGLGGAAPAIGAFTVGGPWVGGAYMFAQTSLEQQCRLLLANPSMTPTQALEIGAAVAIPMTALQSISYVGIKGMFPELEASLGGWASTKLGGFVLNTGVGTAAFSASETVTPLADAAIHSLNPKWNTESNPGKELKEVLLNAPQDFGLAVVFATMHMGHPVDVKKSEAQTEKAMRDMQKEDAPQMHQTADGDFAVTTPDENGQHTPVFHTDDPNVAADALAMAHQERNSEPVAGNDWTTATDEGERAPHIPEEQTQGDERFAPKAEGVEEDITETAPAAEPKPDEVLSESETPAADFTPDDLSQKADDLRLKLAGNPQGGFVDIGAIHDGLAEYGRAIYEKGQTFAEWTKRMVADLGEKVRGFLSDVWNAIKTGGGRFLPGASERGSIGSKVDELEGKKAREPTFKESAKRALGNIKSALRDMPEDTPFRRSLLEWSGRNQESTHEIDRAMREIERTVPDPKDREGITNWLEAGGDKRVLEGRAASAKDEHLAAGYDAALHLSPEALQIADKIQQTFHILETRGERWGISMGHRENYVPHLYEGDQPPVPTGTSSKRLNDYFRFSKERVFENYADAEQNGFKAQTKDISKLVGIYLNDMNNAINSRRFVAELNDTKASDGRPIVSARGGGTTVEKSDKSVHLVYPDMAQDGTADYRKLDQPALHDWVFAGKDAEGNTTMVRGDLAVHPEAANHLSNVLSTSAISRWVYDRTGSPISNAIKSGVNAILQTQAYLKGTGLSFSPFHQVQEGIHAIGHKINPLDVPNIDLRSPEQKDAIAVGLMLSHDRISQSQFREGVGENGSNLITLGLRKLGWGISRAAAEKVDSYQDWLFTKYIPGLKFQTYQHILERNTARFSEELKSGKVSEWQVKNLSAKQANAAYGHLNYADIGRDPTVQHIMQIALLAPDFLEARARFVGQALKGLAGGKVGAEQLQALMLLAITQVIGGRIANKLTNDEWDMKHPFEVRVGNTYYGFRSVPEDLYKLSTDFTGFAGGRISPLFGRFIQEGLFHTNYRGEHTSAGDAISDIFSGVVPGPFQAFARKMLEYAPAEVQKAAHDLPGTARNNSISPFEQLLSSTGLQVHRFSPISRAYPLAEDWIKKNYPELAQKDGGTYPVSKFQQLRYALEDNDTEKAQKQLAVLHADGMDDSKIAHGFKASMTHPFTGTKSRDQEFYAAQNEDGKKVIDAANERRALILDRFQALPQQ